MRRASGYVLLGLIAYLVFMVVQFPATTVFGLLADQVPGLTLQQAQGSILRGSAHHLRIQDIEIKSLSWRWRPLGLITGRITYQLTSEDPELALTGDIGMDWNRRLAFDDLNARLPLARALSLINGPAPPLEGILELDLATLRLDEQGFPNAAQGTVRLTQTRTTLVEPVALGDFDMALTTEDQGIRGTVTDKGGPVRLNGNLTLTLDNRYRLVGEISARDNHNQNLRQVLSLLGPPGEDGTWKMDITGTL